MQKKKKCSLLLLNSASNHLLNVSHVFFFFRKCGKVTGSHVLEELGDVFPAAFGPHPGVGVVVECGGHDVLLNLNTVLFTLVTVVVGHVEPAGHNAYMHTDVSGSADVEYLHATFEPVARTVSTLFVKLVERRSRSKRRRQERGVMCTALHLIAPGAQSPAQPTAVRSQSSTGSERNSKIPFCARSGNK